MSSTYRLTYELRVWRGGKPVFWVDPFPTLRSLGTSKLFVIYQNKQFITNPNSVYFELFVPLGCCLSQTEVLQGLPRTVLVGCYTKSMKLDRGPNSSKTFTYWSTSCWQPSDHVISGPFVCSRFTDHGWGQSPIREVRVTRRPRSRCPLEGRFRP